MARLHLGVVLHENPVAEVARLHRSLMALERAPGLELVLRFLDNSPTAALREPVGKAFGPGTYRSTGKNLGFGAAHNLGLREAVETGAAGYLCLNPDAQLHPACVRELWAVAELPGTGLVDARTFPEEHPKPYDPLNGETPWCAGTVLLVRPEAFHATGGFDEALFLYGEDVDLSWRVRAAGLSTRTAPRALALHWVEHRPLTPERALQVIRSAAYLGRKWGRPGFARRYERLYRALAARTLELPVPGSLPSGARQVADFEHGVRFARSRW